MARHYERFIRSTASGAELDEIAVVDEIAARLLLYINDSARRVDEVHIHGASSTVVQAILGELLTEVGFKQEVMLTPQDGFVTRARPDFVYELSRGRGIIAEVERGGTTTNNHDLKDFWKAHIAGDAHHLFLMVPVANWNRLGLPREKPFARVVHRMSAFFGDPRREVDVLSAHIFGYGAEVPARRP